MKTVSARQANHDFSELLARGGAGRGNPDHETEQACRIIVPYQPPQLRSERQAAIKHATDVMAQGLPWGAAIQAFTRDEMHER